MIQPTINTSTISLAASYVTGPVQTAYVSRVFSKSFSCPLASFQFQMPKLIGACSVLLTVLCTKTVNRYTCLFLAETD